MAKIKFGQITLEDNNMNIDQLIKKYLNLFENEEFKLPFISMIEEEDEYDINPEDEEEVEKVPQQPIIQQ